MASRSPAGKPQPPSDGGVPRPAHILFQVGRQGYLLTRQFRRPPWAQLIDSHARSALTVLNQAARENPGFASRLRATFGHDVAPIGSRDRTTDAVASVAMLIERRRLYLFRLGEAPPPPPKRLADLRIDVPPVRQIAPDANGAPAPSDLPSRMLIVVEGMREVPPRQLGREAGELIAALLVAGAALRIAALIAAWIAAHFTPVGWLVDVGMVGYGVWMVGLGFIDALKRLLVVARAVQNARTRGDLKAQSAPLAKLLLEAGLTAMLTFFLKGMNKRKRAGTSEQQGTGSAPPAQRKSAPVPGKDAPAASPKRSAALKPPVTPAQGDASAASVRDKLDRYLLNPDHPVGGPKAKFFDKALGYTRENADGLARQIVFDEGKAVQTAVTQYGTKYNQVIDIVGANGRVIPVQSAWIKGADGVAKLVTAVPAK